MLCVCVRVCVCVCACCVLCAVCMCAACAVYAVCVCAKRYASLFPKKVSIFLLSKCFLGKPFLSVVTATFLVGACVHVKDRHQCWGREFWCSLYLMWISYFPRL